ncbi:hypothetical protein [Allonocardiopsis opalescens]|uniref:Flagellin-like protein n=1 Tax=Allonocardiopsis opalescens TaxID=1144618 RepID=A0A2T0QAU4_9ACTN|nr:hypothetical protein [Allonocardiopsis opalescens]PRY00931.1 hypothetical protein CLV72_102564 [Allonocardiopsis opalescens]
MNERDGGRGPLRGMLDAFLGTGGSDGDGGRRSRRNSLVLAVLDRILAATGEKGGKMSTGRLLVVVAVIGLVLVLGFLAYRMIMIELILGLARER